MKLCRTISVASLFLLCSLVAARNTSANEQDMRKQSGSQSQELAKADQLNAEVLKLYREGKYVEAFPLATQVLEIREKALGPDHLLVGVALQNLAELFIARKKQREAIEAYRRSLAIQEKSSGVNDPQFTTLLERYLCVLAASDRKDEMNRVRERLFRLENNLSEDESGDSSSKGSKADKPTPGKAVSLPVPSYLPQAKEQRVSGSVVMKVRLDETGKVIELKALCGNPLLIEGTEPAAWKARFVPLVVAGQPLKSTNFVVYRFVRD